ncbi:C4-dicarboxylate transport protein [Gemmatimonadetes bacterium T265]|nr:C4-dicarboxylate transport protein [Gemmatimonadetes bacterium T265]
MLPRSPTIRVLFAITAGALLGALAPAAGVATKPLADAFVALVKLVVGPVVFCTIVLGIAGMRDLRTAGRVGGKAILYFEVMTTFALALGLLVVNLTRPGAGLDATALAKGDVSKYAQAAREGGVVDLLVHAVPSSAVDAFARGDVIQIVVVAVLTGVALAGMGDRGRPLTAGLGRVQELVFRVVSMVMAVAPVGAFAAMAYTVGSFGVRTLLPLGRLMLDVYATMALFVFGVLGLVARRWGFRITTLLRHIRGEIALVIGTSSSEAALPRLMTRLEEFGCAPQVVGLVVPAGYSFNLDGTSIYLSMAVLFIAQVFRVDLSFARQLEVLGLLMLTSKGAAGVTGSGFVVLASTLAATRAVPVEGLALVLGVDRFMSEARAVVNLIGNAVATVVVAKSEGAFAEADAPSRRSGGPDLWAA